MNVLAIDPGGTTGIAFTYDNYTTLATDSPEYVWRIVASDGLKWDVVLCERFATAGRISHYGLATVEIVGGVRALCAHLSIPFIYRQPQHRKSAQREAHGYLAGVPHVIHEEDALAHLMAYLHDQELLGAMKADMHLLGDAARLEEGG